MKKMDEEFALLLEAVDATEAGLAQSLLKAEGIPCVIQGPDFDVVELGRAAHDSARGTNVYVPHAAYEQAQTILKLAWGDAAPSDD